MTTKHALGPLGSFAQAAYGHGIAPINSAGHRSGEFIAVVHFADKSRGQSTDGQKAYARLFAAAPELLAALEDLVKNDMQSIEYDGQMLTVCADCGTQDGEHTSNCAYVRARAAIAKAKGEQA